MLFRVTFVTYFAYASVCRLPSAGLVHASAFLAFVLANVRVGAATACVVMPACITYAD